MPGRGRHSARSEAWLIERAIAGDGRARGELAQRHWDDLFQTAHLILRDVHDAEDVTQEALIAAFDSLGKFDKTRPLRPWLVKILTNRALDQGRATGRRNRLHEQIAVERPTDSSEATPEAEALRDAIEELSPEDRALLVLRYVLEYRSNEIAEVMDLPDGTVRSRLKRALDQMRTTMNVEAS